MNNLNVVSSENSFINPMLLTASAQHNFGTPGIEKRISIVLMILIFVESHTAKADIESAFALPMSGPQTFD